MLLSLAKKDVELIVPIHAELIEALNVPEAQTRQDCLEALTYLVDVHPELAADAFDGADESLFDEDAAGVRLAAFRFLVRYGLASPECSLRAWPIIADALQCYHGDPEYREMLSCLREFVQGSIDDEVKAALAERMAFDAKNARGIMRAYANEIYNAAGR